VVEPRPLPAREDRGETLTVRVIGDRDGDALRDVPRYTPSGEQVSGPIVLRL